MNKRNHFPFLFALIGILGILLWGTSGTTAWAHGGAELTVVPATAAPGDEITVKGEGVEAGEVFAITVEGLSFQAELGDVTVGDDEDFHQDFTLPADIPAGTYQVRATSGEGEVLTAELGISATADASAEQAAPPEPSNEPMDLERGTTTGQLTTIIIGLVVAAGLGIWMVKRNVA